MAFGPLFPLAHTMGRPPLGTGFFVRFDLPHHDRRSYVFWVVVVVVGIQMFGGLGVDVRNDDGKPRNLCELHQLCCPGIIAGTEGGEGASFYDFAAADDDENLTADGKAVKVRRKRAVDFINVLPAEISLHILSFLPIADVGATLPRVNKAWKRYARAHAQHTRVSLGHTFSSCTWAQGLWRTMRCGAMRSPRSNRISFNAISATSTAKARNKRSAARHN
jgi:hypothetical protein